MNGFRLCSKSAMQNKLRIREFCYTCFITLMCLSCSLLNYFLVQSVGGYFLPLTIVPIFCAFAYGANFSVVVVFLLGLIDDILMNGTLGIYPTIYLLITYFLCTQSKDLNNRRGLLIAFLLLFITLNLLSCVIF